MSVPARIFSLFVQLTLMLSIASCSVIKQRSGSPLFDPDAYRQSAAEKDEVKSLTESLKGKNPGLTTYKGIGKVKLLSDKQVLTTRAAWIGDSSARLRFEILGVHGGPIAAAAVNGKRFYYHSHADGRYYARTLTDEGFKPLVSFPLPAEVLTCLLTGRIPIDEFRAAKIMENPEEEGFVLTLVAKKKNKAQKIFLDRGKKSVFKIEYYDQKGMLEIRAVLDRKRRVSGFDIPFSIDISDGKGSGIRIDIDRYWTNIPVDSSMFMLSRNTG
jgi:hypothetical protein